MTDTEIGNRTIIGYADKHTLRPGDNKLCDGGFLGTSKKAPFKWRKTEWGATAFIGYPTDYKHTRGFTSQGQLESYFK